MTIRERLDRVALAVSASYLVNTFLDALQVVWAGGAP